MNAHYQANDYKINNEDNKYNEDKEDNKIVLLKPQYSSLYFITHLILSFFAIYLSWKCSKSNFNAIHFVIALFCPHLYIIWALAVHGGCGIFECQIISPINNF